jgi:hypothetical protein
MYAIAFDMNIEALTTTPVFFLGAAGLSNSFAFAIEIS